MLPPTVWCPGFSCSACIGTMHLPACSGSADVLAGETHTSNPPAGMPALPGSWKRRVACRAVSIGIGTWWLILGLVPGIPASSGELQHSTNEAEANELVAAEELPRLSPQDTGRRQGRSDLVFKDRIAPHWFHENTRFWYRNDLHGGTK